MVSESERDLRAAQSLSSSPPVTRWTRSSDGSRSGSRDHPASRASVYPPPPPLFSSTHPTLSTPPPPFSAPRRVTQPISARAAGNRARGLESLIRKRCSKRSGRVLFSVCVRSYVCVCARSYCDPVYGFTSRGSTIVARASPLLHLRTRCVFVYTRMCVSTCRVRTRIRIVILILHIHTFIRAHTYMCV